MGNKETERRAARTKDIDLSIEIDASPEAVWRAISDGEELARWFPLDAEVVPGVGGTVTVAWGPDVVGTGHIDVWEENRRLRYVESGGDQDVVVQEGGGEAAVVAVEYTIEGRGGRTVLRLVNSGFSADDDWAEYFDTVESGWRYFLLNLKHYLERHGGTPRRMVRDRRKISLPEPDAWEQLWSGHPVAVEMVAHPLHLACRCEELNDALLFVELEPGQDTYSLGVWLSLYGVAEDQAQELERSLGDCLERLF